METPQTDDSESAQADLLKVFAARLNHAIDQNPELQLSGRARTNGFANKFGMHYSTAHRILNGEAFPSMSKLVSICQVLGVTESWLLGHDRSDSFVPAYTLRMRKFAIGEMSHGAEVVFSSPEVPPQLQTSELICTRLPNDEGFMEDLLVKVTPVPVNGAVHVFYDPAKKQTFLRRISIIEPRREIVCFTLKQGTTDTYAFDDIVFGETDAAKKLSVVGPVLARVLYNFKGDL